MLASTANLPIYDKLSDIYGRKPVFILGTMVARELSEDCEDSYASIPPVSSPRAMLNGAFLTLFLPLSYKSM